MSAHKRFFVKNLPESGEVILEGEEFTHARTVLRVCEGEEIVLLDGAGGEFSAIVQKIEKRRLSAHIIGRIEDDKEPKTFIYLLCGALKGDKTELIIQKACELGAGKIGVFSSEYSSCFVNENKIERWNRVAREAAKQCLRSRVPEVVYFSDLKSALQSAENCRNKFFACEFSRESDGDFSAVSGSTAIAVGSEGGFSQSELALAESLDFNKLCLGKRILRAETAAIAVVALAAYFLGELK